MPLVLGGEDDIEPIVDSDASHGTGPNSRSISGELSRLNEKSGAISVKSKAQTSVKMPPFEYELDNTTTIIKTVNRVFNTLTELTIDSKQPRVRQNNDAMINFVKRNASARGAGYIEQRMFYTREEHYKGRVNLEHRSGKILIIITADKLTKLGNVVEEHQKIAADIQGLIQLGYDFYNNRDSTIQSRFSKNKFFKMHTTINISKISTAIFTHANNHTYTAFLILTQCNAHLHAVTVTRRADDDAAV